MDNFASQYANFLVGHDLYNEDYNPEYHNWLLEFDSENTYSIFSYNANGNLQRIHYGMDTRVSGSNTDLGQPIYAGFSGQVSKFSPNNPTVYANRALWEDAKGRSTSLYWKDNSDGAGFRRDTTGNDLKLNLGFNYLENGESFFVNSQVTTQAYHFHEVARNFQDGEFIHATEMLGTKGNMGYSKGVHYHQEYRAPLDTVTFMDWLVDPYLGDVDPHSVNRKYLYRGTDPNGDSREGISYRMNIYNRQGIQKDYDIYSVWEITQYLRTRQNVHNRPDW